MATQQQPSTDEWARYFDARGYRTPTRLAAGVEGTVYRLGAGIVAKVWNGRAPTGLDLTRRVYADIAEHRLPFGTPRILRTEVHRGVVVSFERELDGTRIGPDSAISPPTDRDLPARQSDAVLTVLRALSTVPATPAMRRLTVQGDDRPLWRDHARFPDALAALVHRATRRRGDLLAAHVPGLSTTIDRTIAALRAMPDTPAVLIHGDLVPPNVLVDETGDVTAVLDFGFFTTAGDPAFEAAVTAAIWDMYGPHARHHTAALTRLFASALGHSPQTMALYQTVYALTTYDLFSQDGSDGHFRWCAALLNDR